jgi:radical SAM protein with 4Fe4S-binding SPASM domain
MMLEVKENNVTRHASFDVHERLAAVIGPRYLEYRQLWDKAGPSSIPDFPIHLDLELADTCNKTCSFCPRDLESHPGFKGLIGTGKTLTQNTVDSIIEQSGDNNLFSVNFGAGNEPLMCDNLLSTVNKFHDAGVVDSWVISNGILLDKWTEGILDSPLVNLFISIDAHSEASYKKLRGYGFKRIQQALLKFLDRRAQLNRILPLVRVSFIVHPDNLHEKQAFQDFWEDKVDFIDFQTFYDYSEKYKADSQLKKRECLDPFRRLAVHGDGWVVPCASDFGLGLRLGSIHQMSLKEIWNSQVMHKIRADVIENRNDKCVLCQCM